MIKLKKIIKKFKGKNPSQSRLTWLTHHTRHEILMEKKSDFLKRAKQKRSKLNKKTLWTKMQDDPS